MSDRDFFDAVAAAMQARFGVLMPGWFLIKPQYRAIILGHHAAESTPEAAADHLARLTAQPHQAAA